MAFDVPIFSHHSGSQLIIIIIGYLWRPISWASRALTKADKHVYYISKHNHIHTLTHIQAHIHTHKLHTMTYTAGTHVHTQPITTQSLVTKTSAVQKISRWIFIEILNLCCDLALITVISFFRKTLRLMMMYDQPKLGYKRTSSLENTVGTVTSIMQALALCYSA